MMKIALPVLALLALSLLLTGCPKGDKKMMDNHASPSVTEQIG